MSPVSVCVLIFISFSTMAEARQCPGVWQGRYSCCTQEKYPSSDLSKARAGCEGYGLHLCSLDELADAWEAGYHYEQWGLVDKPGHDAMVTHCSSKYVKNGECFAPNNYDTTKIQNVMGYIPSTPRASDSASAYCCR